MWVEGSRLRAACLLLVWGAVSLGRSFRMALPESKQPLITHSLYRWIRNPLGSPRSLGLIRDPKEE